MKKAIERLKEEYLEGEIFYKPRSPRVYGVYSFMLDDRVDRKIIKYLNETSEIKYSTIMEKYREYKEERFKLRQLVKSNQLDKDSFDDQNREWRKYETVKQQIERMLDCGEGLKRIESFILEGIKNKTNNFNNIKTIEKIVFNSVDGRVFGNAFIYKITGYVDCYLKSGMFSKNMEKSIFQQRLTTKQVRSSGLDGNLMTR